MIAHASCRTEAGWASYGGLRDSRERVVEGTIDSRGGRQRGCLGGGDEGWWRSLSGYVLHSLALPAYLQPHCFERVKCLHLYGLVSLKLISHIFSPLSSRALIQTKIRLLARPGLIERVENSLT